MFSLQMLLEMKDKEVGKLIEETQNCIKDLTENIDQAKVSSTYKPVFMTMLWPGSNIRPEIQSHMVSAKLLFAGLQWSRAKPKQYDQHSFCPSQTSR